MRKAWKAICEEIAWITDQARPHLPGLTRALRIEPLGLVLVAFLCEAPVLLARSLTLIISGAVVFAVIGMHLGGSEIGLLLLAPVLWPLAALIVPFPSGWWWMQTEGGREPSQRERLAYRDSIEILQAHGPQALILPSRWFVLDTPEVNAAVCGDTLMLSRGLVESEHLPAVIAHELGHLASSDGRLAAALNRLPILRRPRASRAAHPQQQTRPSGGLAPYMDVEQELIGIAGRIVLGALRVLFCGILFMRGGYGLRLTRALWGNYWRSREYHADQYAAMLGQAEELADFLEIHALIHDQPIPFIWLTDHTHPPSELRIDRLRAHADQQPPALPQ